MSKSTSGVAASIKALKAAVRGVSKAIVADKRLAAKLAKAKLKAVKAAAKAKKVKKAKKVRKAR